MIPSLSIAGEDIILPLVEYVHLRDPSGSIAYNSESNDPIYMVPSLPIDGEE